MKMYVRILLEEMSVIFLVHNKVHSSGKGILLPLYNCNKLSSTMTGGEFLDQFRNCHILKKESGPWSQLANQSLIVTTHSIYPGLQSTQSLSLFLSLDIIFWDSHNAFERAPNFPILLSEQATVWQAGEKAYMWSLLSQRKPHHL